MVRWTETAGGALLMTVALISYGVKEETRALEREAAALEGEVERLTRRLETLEVEWSHVTSPQPLRRIAERLYGQTWRVGAENAALAPWRPEQRLDLRPAPATPEPAAAEPLATGDAARPGPGREAAR
ncbi:MAG: hypothetical protein AAFR16_05560 [Pseudomonadota bacterium]